MKLLRNDSQLVLTEHLLCPYDRVPCAKACIVEVYDIRWNAPCKERVFHYVGFRILLATIVSTDEDELYLPCLIELFCGINTIQEEMVLCSCYRGWHSANHHADIIVRNIGNGLLAHIAISQ